jgi:hypothetical protein
MVVDVQKRRVSLYTSTRITNVSAQAHMATEIIPTALTFIILEEA